MWHIYKYINKYTNIMQNLMLAKLLIQDKTFPPTPTTARKRKTAIQKVLQSYVSKAFFKILQIFKFWWGH